MALKTDSSTKISRNGGAATLADIKVGDRAEARYDATSMLASRIEARSAQPQPLAQVEGKVTAVASGSVMNFVSDVEDATARIDIIDRLPTPFGLARYGVAPDHQGTKGVTPQLDRLLAKPGVRVRGSWPQYERAAGGGGWGAKTRSLSGRW